LCAPCRTIVFFKNLSYVGKLKMTRTNIFILLIPCSAKRAFVDDEAKNGDALKHSAERHQAK
jgi:hypothetical protein